MSESGFQHLQPQASAGRYDPLPYESANNSLRAPGSANISRSSTPASQSVPLPTDLSMDDLPSGAQRPRFMGHALRDDPSLRYSYASSNNSNFQGAGGSVNSSVYALNTNLGPGASASATHLAAYRDDPHGGFEQHDDPSPSYLDEKRAAYLSPRTAKKKRWGLYLGILAIVVIIAAAVLIPVYIFVIKPHSSTSSTTGSAAATATATGSAADNVRAAITGGTGSTVTMDDGTTFTYTNNFGGYWYWDETDPFNNGAKAQSWTPALNETFNYGVDKIRGYVMLLFVPERAFFSQ